MGLCIDFLQPKEEESWQRLTAVSSSIFAFVVHSAQLVQWILHNLKSTQLPPDYDKNSMIENYTKKIKTHRRAHRFAPPPLKYLPLQFFTDLVSYLVEDVLHVLSALERPNAVDEAAVLKL